MDGRTTTGVRVYVHRYPVLKRTPKGVWLDLGVGMKRFVRDDARKQFACPTYEDALISFAARKRKQIKIYKERLRQAERALLLIPDDVIGTFDSMTFTFRDD